MFHSTPLKLKLKVKKVFIIPSPAGAAGGEEEPVHEDPGAVVVRVVGQQPVPLVFLLTGAVPGAAEGALLGADLLQTNKITLEVAPFFC